MIEKQLRKYIIPNILAMVGTSCYVLADTFFIAASAGANGITALNLTLPVYGVIFALGSMLGVGSATRYSLQKALGAPDADDYFSNSILYTLLISLIFVALGILWPGGMLRLLGADDVILNLGLDYLRIVLCFTPFFMLNYTFTAFVRNDGAPKVAMAATLVSGLFNIVFDYIPDLSGTPGHHRCRSGHRHLPHGEHGNLPAPLSGRKKHHSFPDQTSVGEKADFLLQSRRRRLCWGNFQWNHHHGV